MSNKNNDTSTLHKDVENEFDAHENDSKFERALGRFIIAWSDTEAELYRVLVRYSGVSDPVARAIFSGTRVKAMVDFIRSIAHNTAMPQDQREDLEHAFLQLNAINSMRDHLAHYASASYSFKDPLVRVVANERASRYGNGKGYEVRTETIEAMIWDLYGIANCLNAHWGPRSGPFQPWRENPEDNGPLKWSYKSLQPIPT